MRTCGVAAPAFVSSARISSASVLRELRRLAEPRFELDRSRPALSPCGSTSAREPRPEVVDFPRHVDGLFEHRRRSGDGLARRHFDVGDLRAPAFTRCAMSSSSSCRRRRIRGTASPRTIRSSCPRSVVEQRVELAQRLRSPARAALRRLQEPRHSVRDVVAATARRACCPRRTGRGVRDRWLAASVPAASAPATTVAVTLPNAFGTTCTTPSPGCEIVEAGTADLLELLDQRLSRPTRIGLGLRAPGRARLCPCCASGSVMPVVSSPSRAAMCAAPSASAALPTTIVASVRSGIRSV